MKKILSLVIVMMLALTMFSGLAANATIIYPDPVVKPNFTDKHEVNRIFGANRIDTAIEISQAWGDKTNFTDNTNGNNTIVIANAYNFPDALAGAPLANYLSAPILLTAGKTLEDNLADRIIEMKPNATGAITVYLLGGTSVISAGFEKELKALAPVGTIKRLSGDNRYETAVAVAEELGKLVGGKLPGAFLVNGTDFPDALSASWMPIPLPILFTPNNSSKVNAVTAKYLADNKITPIVLGGEYAVPGSVISDLLNTYKISISARVAGKDRYETSLNLYRDILKIMGATSIDLGNNVVLATGTNYPDALVGGAFACQFVGPLILVNGTGSVNTELKNFIHGELSVEDEGENPCTAWILGGSTAVSSSVANAYFPGQQVDPDVKNLTIMYDDLTVGSSESDNGVKDVTIYEGKTLQLKAVVDPRPEFFGPKGFTGWKGNKVLDNSVTWKSDDTSVATVDANGKVTVSKTIKTFPAYALISAETKATNEDGKKVSVTFRVKVTDEYIPVTSMKFTDAAKKMWQDDEVKFDLTAAGGEFDAKQLIDPLNLIVFNTKAANTKLTPSNTGIKVSVPNNGIATVEKDADGNETIIKFAGKAGWTTITVTSLDNPSATDSVRVYIQ